MRLELDVLPGRFAACRLAPVDPVPAWVPAAGSLIAVTRTSRELSVICDDSAVPQAVRAERGFCALAVRGPLPFDATGILASISSALAAAGIPALAISTFDTDYVLVREERLDNATQALRAGGCVVFP